MDSSHVKFDKAIAILKFHVLSKITTLFRFIEFFVFLLLIISKFSTHLPLTFNISASAEFLQQVFSVTSISPRFVFLLSNAIVFVLFLSSRQFSDQDNSESWNIKADTYMENCENYCLIDETKVISNVCSRKGRKIQKSCSAKIKRVNYEGDGGQKLNRSVTDISWRGKKSPANCYYSAEEMSGEEFQRKVEAFIARQQRSLREEF
ncbi:hypothetical protein LguiA_008979 [Lonicera macranthoides]